MNERFLISSGPSLERHALVCDRARPPNSSGLLLDLTAAGQESIRLPATVDVSTLGVSVSSKSSGKVKSKPEQRQCAAEYARCIPSAESPTDTCSPGTRGAAYKHAAHE